MGRSAQGCSVNSGERLFLSKRKSQDPNDSWFIIFQGNECEGVPVRSKGAGKNYGRLFILIEILI